MADFLRDVGTLMELQAWSERLEVARLIAEKKTYREIADTTGASTTTVTRVARFLQGSEGGYRHVLREIHQHTTPRVRPAGHRHEAHPNEETLVSTF